MPDTVRLHHVVDGDTGPAVLLGASLGTDLGLWDDLAADLARDHRVVRFDTRGHGRSPAPVGGYTVEGLAADVVALADDLGIDRFAYVGLSLGGAIGQVLALAHPERLTCLVLASTAPVFGEPATWRERAGLVRRDGLEPLVGPTFDRWFTDEFRSAHPEQVARVRDMFVATPRPGYAGCCEALSTYDVTDRLDRIAVPTRVVVGAEDPATTPDVGRSMVAAIRDADLVVVEGTAHLANLARPGEFRSAVRGHLATCGS